MAQKEYKLSEKELDVAEPLSTVEGADESEQESLSRSLSLSLDLVSRKWSVGSVRGGGEREREASRLTLVGRGLHEEEVVVNKRESVCV